jgi:hypothetical protein
VCVGDHIYNAFRMRGVNSSFITMALQQPAHTQKIKRNQKCKMEMDQRAMEFWKWNNVQWNFGNGYNVQWKLEMEQRAMEIGNGNYCGMEWIGYEERGFLLSR